MNGTICPDVEIRDDGNYYCQGIYYGRNKRKARELYFINNPMCNYIPPELDNRRQSYRSDPTCPFVVQTNFNPCLANACEEIDLANTAPEDLPGRCASKISNYCYENAEYDDFCKCWTDENQNDAECIEYRSKFINPEECNVNPGSFPIEEHPDFHEYIKKTNIPCWNCKL